GHQSDVANVAAFLHIMRTGAGYFVSMTSLVSRTSGSSMAWATSMRSKGSRCTGGSLDTATVCTLRTASSLNAACGSEAWNSSTSILKSLRRKLALIDISHTLAAL